jgi:tetratricopeptide (TPR) repeat protein
MGPARLFGMRDWQGALHSLRGIASTEANYLDLAYFLGLCHTRLEQWDEALLYLEQVVTSGSDFMRIYQCRMALAFVYSKTGRFKLAEYELARLHASGFESMQVLSFLGYTAWAQGRAEEAIGWYNKALELDAEYATALNGLGFVLASEGRDVAKALTYCRKAVDKSPNNPAYLDSLAWAYHRLGFEDEARGYIGRALSISPGVEEIRGHARAIAGGREGESMGGKG